MTHDEPQLVRRAQRGDAAAFEMLVNRHAQYVYNLALRILRDPHEAEDLAQEVFVRVWKALPRYRAEARFRTWLYRIVANLCYDRLPGLRREFSALDQSEARALASSHRQPEAAVLSREMQARLHAAIDDLPESYRLLIMLRHLQEMSYAEIAEVTGQPLGTVKTGIFRARRMLKETIEAYEKSGG